MSVPYGAPQQQHAGTPAPLGGMNLAQLIGLGVAVLALVSYFCGFADEAGGGKSLPQYLLLAGGLFAALSVLPKGPASLQIGAVLSVLGGLGMLQIVVSWPGETPSIVVVILIAAILQLLGAVAMLLADAGVIKIQPKPAGMYGQPGSWNPGSGGFPQPGQFGQPQQHGQAQQQGGQPGPQSTGQFGAAGQQAPAPTSFMPQPGQFGQVPQPGQQGAQPGQYGQSGQGPGTPPGGFASPTQPNS
ncbi:DUF5336 domain-containing protein [Goodfellowiella coeruleoviolacea]|uniref:34 kDa antigenic protein n=1 Tax=Goodfellowiella coeruleoviolacea TaxID=334858 RepID=A0AAE3GE92_9PSEU|nr:DUF5336 domain-containing protein [Goodfellowiella coeruleoviolacea]MCP2165729.1 hypothetical protein [Goodfellowiella coeruleoviolacea]